MAKGKTPKGKRPRKSVQNIRKDIKTLIKDLEVLYQLSDPLKPGKPKQINDLIEIIKDTLVTELFLCANPEMKGLTSGDLGPAGTTPGKTERS